MAASPSSTQDDLFGWTMRRGRRRLLVMLAARGICVDCRSIRVTSDVRILHSDGRQMALSPSSISSFQQCPLLFKMRHIDRKQEPATPKLAAGIFVHETLASLYELPAEERRLDVAQNLFREKWRAQRMSKRYGPLFGLDAAVAANAPRAYTDVERERAWGLQAFELLRAYFTIEDPQRLAPLGCEERVAAEISSLEEAAANIPLTGVIDRLDGAPPEETDGGLTIVDYKTGRSPPKHRHESQWFQLEMYALLLSIQGRTPRALRLLYLGDSTLLERPVDKALLERVVASLREIWIRIVHAARTDEWPATSGPLCNFCAHKATCPAFANGDSARAPS